MNDDEEFDPEDSNSKQKKNQKFLKLKKNQISILSIIFIILKN